MLLCFSVIEDRNKRARHREDRRGQVFALRNCLCRMQYVVDRTELVGVREQKRGPSFLVLRKLRPPDRDGSQPAYVRLLEATLQS